MKYEYRIECNSSKLLYVKEIPGLPADISFPFSNTHIRFYKSELNGYFHCTFAIPAISDDEGYVLEMDFLSSHGAEDEITFDYLVPRNDQTFENLSKSATCLFEEQTEMGQRMLLLNMRIDGTPFMGCALIPRDLYAEA